MNQTTRQRITGTLVLAVTALVLLPVIFDGEGSYQPSVQPDIPTRPTQPQAALQDAQRPVISADSDAIRIRPETPATVIIGSDDSADTAASSDQNSNPDSASGINETDELTSADDRSSTVPTAATPVPVQPESSPVPSEPAQTTTQTTTQTTAPAQTAALDVQGLPEGWSVRLGSFSSTENASNLVTRLQEAGHRAYTRRIQSDQGMLTAVFVGPQVDRATAQNLMERLRQDFQLNGMVVRYEIEQL